MDRGSAVSLPMKILAPAAIVAAAMFASSCSTVPAAKVASAPTPQPAGAPYLWTLGNAPKAHKDMVATFGRAGLKPNEFVWAAKVPAEGEPRVVVDRLTQMTYAYRGDVLVGAASVSTASKGRITPLGEWKVLDKRKFHRSRKYNNAPMPFMQRIDDYGIALHGGPNPGYPASHGCIRLPMKFAEKLFGLTKVGSKVIVEG
ncbi:MAG TPA: L,D-transpeptidase family protein [Sphingomicrobium sp.]|jgi:lipoprotein-anchoring transpeptidase ErfK/SrfK